MFVYMEDSMIIKEMPISQVINYKYSQLTSNFYCYSHVLKKWLIIPEGLIMDWESIPIIRGTSKISGLIHDYLCRSDSKPIVSKKVAALVYLEALKYRNTPYIRRYVKYWVVRIKGGYFHKRKVFDKFIDKGLFT